MIIRKIDGENDWTFGKGLSNYATDELAIDENVKTRILSWVGDCFFAPNEGVDWKSRLDVGQKAALEQELRAMILNSYGVVEVNSATVNFNGRTRLFAVKYNIRTFFSPSFEKELQQAIGG